MNDKYVVAFFDALKNVLAQFGLQEIQMGTVKIKEKMHVDKDITAIIGLIGDVRGNVAFCISQETARKIISTMMMGMPVEEIDAMGRSAISEFTNMIVGTATSTLAEGGVTSDISTPSLIFGNDIYFIISSVQAVMVSISTPVGEMEIHIGLEI